MAYKGKRKISLLGYSIFAILSIIVVDRLVKWWCIDVLKELGTIPLIEGVFHFTYAENTGAAFSMLEGRQWLLIAVSVFALALFGYALVSRIYAHLLTDIAFPLVIGGAIGNLWDRVQYGFVVDIFDFRLINFAIFNVADAAISVGAVLIIVYGLLSIKQEYEEQKAVK